MNNKRKTMEKEEFKKFLLRIETEGLKGVKKTALRGLGMLMTFLFYLVIYPIFKLLVLLGFRIKSGLKTNPGFIWIITVAPLVILIIILFVSLKATRIGIDSKIDENTTKQVESQKAFWYKQGYEEAQKTINANIPGQEDVKEVTDEPKKDNRSRKRSSSRKTESVKKSESEDKDEPKKEDKKPEEKKTEITTSEEPVTK